MTYSKWAIGLVLATSLASVPLPAQDAQTGDIHKGRELYEAVGCYQCHGRVGQGGRGPVLARMPYPYLAFEVLVRQPSGGGMPPYTRHVLSDQELTDIYSYLKSLPGPRAAPDLPELLR